MIPGLGVVGARGEQRRGPADGFRVEWARTTGFLGEWGRGVTVERWIASWRMGGIMKGSESLIG